MGARLVVLYGARGRVVAETADEATWLTGAARPSPWLGVRQLIARTSSSDVIARHRAALAIVAPDCVAAPLTADEHRAATALRADLRSHHVHSEIRAQPLIAAVGRFIAELAAATGAALAVPELADLDPDTARALGEAWRASSALRLWIGHDPALARPAELAWGVPVSWPLARVRSQLCDYQLAPGCEVRWLADGPTAPLPALAEPAAERTDLAAMRRACEAYAFPAAFRIGAALEPAPADRAAHARLTAIAATCAHFVDVPTPGFDDRLDAMYARAIELADPLDAAGLAVRRALAAVDRGAADPTRAIDDAAARVARLDGDDAHYHGAWLALIQALHALHGAPRAVAACAVEGACTVIERAEAATQLDELAAVRFLLLSHATIDAAPHDPVLATHWRARADRDRARLSVIHRFEVMHWALLAPREDDRVAIYERCLAGLRDAARCWESRGWYLYRALAADSAYRLGRLADALGHVRALLAVSTFGHAGVALVGDITPLARRVLLRAGARAELAALASDPEGHALVALAAARAGDAAAADAALEHAVDAAVTTGAHAVMGAVAITAVHVLQALGRDALDALATAWQLAEDAPGTWAAAIAPADQLRLCLAEAAARGAPDALVARMLAVLPEALADADAWWDVDRVLAYAEITKRGPPTTLHEPISRRTTVSALGRRRGPGLGARRA